MVKIAGKEYLTSKDVEKLFGVSRTTVNTWRNKGLLKTTVIGSKNYFTKEDVGKLIRKEN
jgi:predicted site-specific integrase-resolvase